MTDLDTAFCVGLMAGSIFFIDGWGPTVQKEEGSSDKEGEKSVVMGLASSKRFRGLAILIAGGIITPILDYVTTKKPQFFLEYLKGCIMGWFFLLLLGLLLYIVWMITRKKNQGLSYKGGELAFTIIDFIYLGISDNPHLKAKRINDVKLYQGLYEMENKNTLDVKNAEMQNQRDELLDKLTRAGKKQKELDGETKQQLEKYEEKLNSQKTESEYSFNDWYLKGRAEYDKKEYEKCIVYMKNALEKGDGSDQGKADAHLYMGISYDSLGLFTKGLEQYDMIISNFPNYDLKYIVYYDMGICLDNLNRQEDAVKAYEESIKLNPKYANSWGNKGVSLNKLGLQEEAVLAYEEAIKLKPDYIDAIYNKGLSLGKIKRYNDSVAAFDEVIKLNQADYEAYCNKGIQLNNLGKHEEAIFAFEKTINIKPDYYLAWYHKGLSLSDLERHEEAVKAYDEAIKLNPSFADTWNARGICKHKLGKDTEAVLDYNEALKIDKNFASAWVNNGVSLLKLNQYDDSLKALEEAKKIDPQYAEAWFNAAAWHALKNSKDVMLENLKKSIELDATLKAYVKTDEDFKQYWNDSDFVKLVA